MGAAACEKTPAEHAPAQPAEPAPRERSAKPGGPRLVVWFTVDQLSAASLVRHEKHLRRGGLARLLERGLHFTNARYEHAATETAPGHATLFTGVPPRVHGIVANEWFDRASSREIVSVEDENAPLLEMSGVSASATSGRSSARLRVPTVGDALVEASEGRARVVSISIKDRAAILPAGKRGRAYWFGAEGFRTSRAYHEALPDWIVRANREEPIERFRSLPWVLSLDEKEYQTRADVPTPYRPRGLGEGFPHALGPDGALLDHVRYSPFGDEAVLSLAERALGAEDLGRDDVPDLLLISLSSTDYIGHQYGPESREAEDNFVALGRRLERFLDVLEREFRKDELLLVLSADHGGADTAEGLVRRGLPGARLGRIQLVEAARTALARAYPRAPRARGDRPSREHATSAWIAAVVPPTLYLDRKRIEEAGVDFAEASHVVEKALLGVPGVQAVFDTHAPFPPGDVAQAVFDSLDAERSGDLYVVPKEHTLFLQEEGLGATHGSPWSYDQKVPVVLVGPGLPARRVERSVSVESLAPTVARLLAIPFGEKGRRPALEEAADSVNPDPASPNPVGRDPG